MTVSSGGSKKESIWVAVRVRPLNEAEEAGGDLEVCQVQKDGATIAFREAAGAGAPVRTGGGGPLTPEPEHRTPAPAAFDAAFSPDVSSQEVYEAAAKSLVLDSCKGMNGTIFAYGQTGSGKTFTMTPLMGMACAEVFDYISFTPGREFLIRLSATEIYNEEVRDLLSLEKTAPLKLMDCPTRGTIAEGLTEIGVHSAEHLHSLLVGIDRHRESRYTAANESSSRSHLIVKLTMESRPSIGDSDAQAPGSVHVMSSTLTFVDLAGSERVRQATVEDSSDKLRLKEGSHINRSLLTLGTIIRLLGSSDRSKPQHIPYRDSKLTRMLQPALGGNARTAIICTVSPSSSQVENTKSTINFAQAAKRVTTQPKVNQVVDAKAQIRSLQSEIANLRSKLDETQSRMSVSTASTILEEPGEAAQQRLLEKELQLKRTQGEKDEAERRLRGLEKLILRAEPGRGLPSVRASWAPNSMKGKPQMGSGLFGPNPKTSLLMGGSTTSITGSTVKKLSSGFSAMRGSWNPGDSLDNYEMQRSRMGAMGPPSRTRESGPLFLNFFLTPTVHKRVKHALDAEVTESTAKETKESAAAQIDQLRLPSDETAQAALGALQAEVRCMKQTHRGGASDAVKILQDELKRIEEDKVIGEFLENTKEETISALRTEIQRLKMEQEAKATADQALARLKSKLSDIGSSNASILDTPSPESDDSGVTFGESGGSPLVKAGSPSRLMSPEIEDTPEVVFKTTLRSPSASPLLDSPRASLFGPLIPSGRPPVPSPSPLGPSSRANKENTADGLKSPAGGRNVSASMATGFRLRKPHNVAVGDAAGEGPAISLYKEELRKVKAFKAAAEEDLGNLQDCLDGYSEQVERLECQKKLLLNQVLKLEFKLDEAHTYIEEVDAVKVTKLEEDLERTKKELHAFRSAQVITQPSPKLQIPSDVRMSMVDRSEGDDWAQKDTADSLLRKIAMLWDEMHVPLLHRSRFYQAFRGRELFYYEAEHRRLEHCAATMRHVEDASPSHQKATRKLRQKAARKLEWERDWLSSQLKWDFEEAEKKELLEAWGVSHEKKPLKALSAKLWSLEAINNGRSHRGMEKSATLVLKLHGQDATDGMWDIVFGKQTGTGSARPSLARTLSGPGGVAAGFKAGLKAIKTTMKSPGGWRTPRGKTSSGTFSSSFRSTPSSSFGGTPTETV